MCRSPLRVHVATLMQAQEKLDLQPPKGTRDFYPDEMRLRNWLFGHWKEVARIYGFEEYDSPVLESEVPPLRQLLPVNPDVVRSLLAVGTSRCASQYARPIRLR